tara:strand:- start:624 stop:1061 length:438 start_codon:yes stop_codon:yes gene_type:complete
MVNRQKTITRLIDIMSMNKEDYKFFMTDVIFEIKNGNYEEEVILIVAKAMKQMASDLESELEKDRLSNVEMHGHRIESHRHVRYDYSRDKLWSNYSKQIADLRIKQKLHEGKLRHFDSTFVDTESGEEFVGAIRLETETKKVTRI